MTLADLMLAHHFYQLREVEEWRRTRATMFTMVRLMGNPKTAPSTIEQFFPLPGDKSDAFNLDTFDIEKEFAQLREQGWNV